MMRRRTRMIHDWSYGQVEVGTAVIIIDIEDMTEGKREGERDGANEAGRRQGREGGREGGRDTTPLELRE